MHIQILQDWSIMYGHTVDVDKFLRQLINGLSCHIIYRGLRWFNHPRWCKISSIHSMITQGLVDVSRLIGHHPYIWGYYLQQTLESDVENPQNGTFTKPRFHIYRRNSENHIHISWDFQARCFHNKLGDSWVPIRPLGPSCSQGRDRWRDRVSVTRCTYSRYNFNVTYYGYNKLVS